MLNLNDEELKELVTEVLEEHPKQLSLDEILCLEDLSMNSLGLISPMTSDAFLAVNGMILLNQYSSRLLTVNSGTRDLFWPYVDSTKKRDKTAIRSCIASTVDTLKKLIPLAVTEEEKQLLLLCRYAGMMITTREKREKKPDTEQELPIGRFKRTDDTLAGLVYKICKRSLKDIGKKGTKDWPQNYTSLLNAGFKAEKGTLRGSHYDKLHMLTCLPFRFKSLNALLEQWGREITEEDLKQYFDGKMELEKLFSLYPPNEIASTLKLGWGYVIPKKEP
jgi:hypothetical protein